ncbi:MAG: malectin domain-containing carbohydrate-binding protein [Cyanobacteria bacterium J06614_10]
MVFTDNSSTFDSLNSTLQSDAFATDILSGAATSLTANSTASSVGTTQYIRVEAEDIRAETYRLETFDFASNGAVASLSRGPKGESGTLEVDFTGDAGNYDIVIGYFDETDGTSTLDSLLNGESLGTVQFDRQIGSYLPSADNLVRRVIGQDQFIQTGDTLKLYVTEQGNEFARIDYIDFISINDTANPSVQSDSLPGPGQQPNQKVATPVRINVGGQEYIDSKGQQWLADQFGSGGNTATKQVNIADTADQAVYQSKRFGNELGYHIPVENGTYSVNLHFAETLWKSDDTRTFDVAIEGQSLNKGVDVHAEVGFSQAYLQSYEGIVVTDGVLDLQLDGANKLAQLSGIEVLPLVPTPIIEPVLVEQVVTVVNAEAPKTSAQSTPAAISAKALTEGQPVLETGDRSNPIRINAGGEDYTDSLGNQWIADSFLTHGSAESTAVAIADTHEYGLYQTARYGNDLNYRVAVENGTYNINLLFADFSDASSGDRLFDIALEGQTVSQHTDIYQSVGYAQAFRMEFESIVVTDGILDLQLSGVRDLAQLSGIEILTAASVNEQKAPLTSPPNVSTPALTSSGNTVRFISPEGNGNGSSWAQAAKITDLDALIEQSSPGDEIWIAGDLGSYYLNGQIINIDSGGTQAGDVHIRGVASKAGGNDTPLFVGTRAEAWGPGKPNGQEVFRLTQGADNLHFSNLNFQNIGNGAFRLGGDITGITIEDMHADNVRRFVENYAASGAQSASVSDLTIRNVEVHGFSKGAIRLQYDTNNVLIEDVFGDSQRQDGDNFAMGVQLDGTAHDIVHRRVTMNNATQAIDDDLYWNADGFVSEEGNYNITYEDTYAAGNTDGGYDLKSSNTLMIRATAADNKRNFRIWGSTTMIDVVSDEPFLRGGNGTTAHIHVLGDKSDLVIDGGTFSGSNGTENIIFDLDSSGKLEVKSAVITDDNYILQTLEEGSQLSMENVVEA